MTQPLDTRERILEVTQNLIQKSGFSAISFADIAAAVGIKKPSIVHHFPSKSALAEAVVIRYSHDFQAALKKVVDNPSKSNMDAFDLACSPYQIFGEAGDMICLCGALAGEYTALPEPVQKEVTRFFEDKMLLLQDILEEGLKNAEFSFDVNTSLMAQHILHSLQGALMIKRATGKPDHIKNTIQLLKRDLLTQA